MLAPFQYLIEYPKMKVPSALSKTLSNLDDLASALLTKSKTYGRVYIVTNATEGWVEISASRFLPKVHEVIKNDVTIISARSNYDQLYPRDPLRWKIEAFLETRADMNEEVLTNLIALGDSHFEIKAAQNLGEQFSNAFIKTIKFRPVPKLNELTE